MDFAKQQRDPTRHLIGIICVILVHVLVIYGLITGLARKAVDVIKKPLTATPPPEPVAIAPPPVVVAPAAPKPAIRRGIVPIERVSPEYPQEAVRKNIAEGNVIARLDIDENGKVTDVRIVEAKPPRIFDREVIRALKQWKFQPDGQKYVGEIEVAFKLE